MNISNREKYLLIIVGLLGISVLYYNFAYSKQCEKLNEVRAKKEEVKEVYDQYMNEIKTLDQRKDNVESLYDNLKNRTKQYYPTISQAKLIIELDKLMQESGIKGDIIFNPEKSSSIEKLKLSEKGKTRDSLEISSYLYNHKISSSDKSKLENETKNNEKKDSSSTDTEKKENTNALCKQQNITIKFNASYQSLKNFILALEKYDKKVVVPTIKVISKSETDVSGEMQVEFYGIAPLDDSTEEYLKWTITNVYGKEIPFSKGVATGAYSSTKENKNIKEDNQDFAMILRSQTSELPTVTIGKGNDEEKLSLLYSDSQNIEDVTIEFKEEDGKLYYKYKTSKDNYPKNNSDLGKEFTPNSDNITIDILSEQRIGISDVSGINLKVINNTDKDVNVTIRNDDSNKPRVNLNSEGKTVNVTKK